MRLVLDPPDAQIKFATILNEIRTLYLQDALFRTVSELEISKIDSELHSTVGEDDLKKMAAHGMRGELMFATPSVLDRNPRLLGYYRLLLGYSQKYFYEKGTGMVAFRSMEFKGIVTDKQRSALFDLCSELNRNSSLMLKALDSQSMSAYFFDQLTLLTLGTQLRGGFNVNKGEKAIEKVMDLIKEIVASENHETCGKSLNLINRSGRKVHIEFSADPDIFIIEELDSRTTKKSLAVEVKGGEDYSNIHNRIGEAEKSHQKAKGEGFTEFWTIVNVNGLDMNMAKKESPTTDRFYHLSDLEDRNSADYRDFKLRISAIIGVESGSRVQDQDRAGPE